jgi:hypothetical protein
MTPARSPAVAARKRAIVALQVGGRGAMEGGRGSAI